MDYQEPTDPYEGYDEVEDRATRLWGMFLHLSIFTGYVVPILGLVAPIIIWQVKKEDLPEIDEHGKNLVNWMISLAIYGIICGFLTLIAVGIPMLMLLGLLSLIFPIVAAIKANNGIVWKYPLSIQFLK